MARRSNAEQFSHLLSNIHEQQHVASFTLVAHVALFAGATFGCCRDADSFDDCAVT